MTMKDFISSFAASALGAAAYDAIKSNWSVAAAADVETVRIFQRALVIALHSGQLPNEIAEVYLQRVAGLPESRRMKYISQLMQPPAPPFDDRQTAVVLCHHALFTDEAWKSMTSVLGVAEDPYAVFAHEMRETFVRQKEKSDQHVEQLKGWYREQDEVRARMRELIRTNAPQSEKDALLQRYRSLKAARP